MLRMLERVPLHFIRIHRGEGSVIDLAGANPDHTLDRLNEDLAVAHFAGARGGENRLDGRLDERLGADHLDLDLLVKLHDDGGSTILTHNFLLTAVATHTGERDARDAGPEQRFLDFRKAFGADDSSDEFHG